MRICNVSELKGGEVLAKPVLTDSYQVLLGEGTKILPEYIEKIQELGIVTVCIESEELEKIEILKNETERKFKEKVKGILGHHTYSHNEELRQLSETADNLISSILDEEEVTQRVYDIKERSPDLYEHSISVCSLAVLTGLQLKMKREVAHDIGVACLLHDLGLRYLTINFNNRSVGKMTQAEQTEYKKHPVNGYSALRDETWISNDAKNMILYHHERMDGKGYPLKARMLTLESRILNLCDAFDEMICGIGYEQHKVSEAISYLKNARNIQFDARTLDAFLKFTAVYPAGTFVLTNEGETALIVRQNENSPDRPVLRIIKDKNGNPVQKKILKDMMNYPNIFIERTIEVQ